MQLAFIMRDFFSTAINLIYFVAFVYLYLLAMFNIVIVNKVLFSGDFSMSIKKRTERQLLYSPRFRKMSCALPS